MIGYVECYDNNKTMPFVTDVKKLLKLDAEPVYGDKYIKTKIKSYNNDIRTNFHGEGKSRKVPKESCSYQCFPLIALDSVIKMGKKYYPQTLLEECKYTLTKKKMEDLITDDFDSSS